MFQPEEKKKKKKTRTKTQNGWTEPNFILQDGCLEANCLSR